MISEKFQKYELLRILDNLEFQVIYHNEKAQGRPSLDPMFPNWTSLYNVDYWDFDIKINDYVFVELINNFDGINYLGYINFFSEKFRDELNQAKSIFNSKQEYLQHLYDILDYLEQVKTSYFELRIENDDIDCPVELHIDVQFNKNIKIIPSDGNKYSKRDDFLKFCISLFISDHKKALDAVLISLKQIIERNEKTMDLSFSKKESANRNLLWTKTDTDLLELIIALYETGAIQNATKDLTQKEAIQVFSDFFGKEIKDQYKKLNAARNRKKEDPGFILKIQKALEAYYQCLNEKN